MTEAQPRPPLRHQHTDQQPEPSSTFYTSCDMSFRHYTHSPRNVDLCSLLAFHRFFPMSHWAAASGSLRQILMRGALRTAANQSQAEATESRLLNGGIGQQYGSCAACGCAVIGQRRECHGKQQQLWPLIGCEMELVWHFVSVSDFILWSFCPFKLHSLTDTHARAHTHTHTHTQFNVLHCVIAI